MSYFCILKSNKNKPICKYDRNVEDRDRKVSWGRRGEGGKMGLWGDKAVAYIFFYRNCNLVRLMKSEASEACGFCFK